MKKQNFSHFVGIDISKSSFDVAILPSNSTGESEFLVFENTQKGINLFIKTLKSNDLIFEQIFFCMEHTGIYGNLIISKLVELNATFCVEMSLKILRSTAIHRGKNDKLDALRIAKYALKNFDELDLYAPTKEVLLKVRLLLSLREKLMLFNVNINKHPKEVEVYNPELHETIEKTTKKITRFIVKQIKQVELDIQQLILNDNELKTKTQLAMSVPGIGKITALYLACFTNLFNKYNSPKQLACYCGVAPFEYSSGTSVYRKPRVHHMANKILKKHLHMGAMSAIRNDNELRNYFERKVEEGKNKMLVLNNVRNKMIQRLCAVISRGTPYLKNN